MSERPFPIQREWMRVPSGRMERVGPLTIPWPDAERAYRAYSAMFGTQQSLERLAERGGFGWIEYRALIGLEARMDERRPETLRRAFELELTRANDEVRASLSALPARTEEEK